MPTINLGLMLWAVAGPALAGGIVYTAMLVREAIVVAGAAQSARNDEVSRCNEQRLDISRTINDSVDAGVAAAVEAARANPPAPTAPAELVALCNADPSCRAREVKP